SPGDITELVDARPFPLEARDEQGRWRSVLDELALGVRIEVEDALALLEREDGDHPPTWYAELLAAALEEGLADLVAKLPCLVLSDDTRAVPPQHIREGVVLADAGENEAARLLVELGLAKQLHPQFLDRDRAKPVSDWLKKLGTLQS